MQQALSPDLNSQRKWVMAIYALQIIGFFVGITFLIAVILNYIKRDTANNTFLETHYSWQIRTFWYSLLWLVVGILTAPFVIGAFILVINFIWVIYRIIRGLMFLSDNKPVYSYKKRAK